GSGDAAGSPLAGVNISVPLLSGAIDGGGAPGALGAVNTSVPLLLGSLDGGGAAPAGENTSVPVPLPRGSATAGGPLPHPIVLGPCAAFWPAKPSVPESTGLAAGGAGGTLLPNDSVSPDGASGSS